MSTPQRPTEAIEDQIRHKYNNPARHGAQRGDEKRPNGGTRREGRNKTKIARPFISLDVHPSVQARQRVP